MRRRCFAVTSRCGQNDSNDLPADLQLLSPQHCSSRTTQCVTCFHEMRSVQNTCRIRRYNLCVPESRRLASGPEHCDQNVPIRRRRRRRGCGKRFCRCGRGPRSPVHRQGAGSRASCSSSKPRRGSFSSDCGCCSSCQCRRVAGGQVAASQRRHDRVRGSQPKHSCSTASACSAGGRSCSAWQRSQHRQI